MNLDSPTFWVRRNILKAMGWYLLPHIKKNIPSKTIRNSMKHEVSSDGKRIQFHTPYYWAGWYFDGTGRKTPKNSRYLIFFRDPKDDPRIEGGYPKTKAEVRKLTREEFAYWAGMNRQAERAGRPWPMIVTKQSGPFKGIRPFRNTLSARHRRELDRIAKQHIDKYHERLAKRRKGGGWK